MRRGTNRPQGWRQLVWLVVMVLIFFAAAKAITALREWQDSPVHTQLPQLPQNAPPKNTGAAKTTAAPANAELYYIRSQLGKNDREMYDQICSMLAAHESQTELRCADSARPFDVYRCVLCDHPEFFWADGAAKSSWHEENGEYCVTLFPQYILSRSEAAGQKKQLDRIADALRKELGSGTDYDKVKGVYEYVIEHTRYDLAASEPDLCSVLLEGKGVCEGYAKSTQYLLQQLGVQTLYVYGQARGGAHAWNVVKIAGSFYHLDTTWGDPIREDGRQKLIYDYFCVTSKEISIDHTLDTDVFCPDCTAVDANWFRREGRYFTSCDREAIERLFEQDSGRRQPVRLRASDPAVLDEITRWLLEDRAVFDILGRLKTTGFSRNKHSYSRNDKMCVLEIYLDYD